MLVHPYQMTSGPSYGASGEDIRGRLSFSSGSAAGIKQRVDRDMDSKEFKSEDKSFDHWGNARPNYMGQMPTYTTPGGGPYSMPSTTMPPTTMSRSEFRRSLPSATSSFDYPPTHTSTTSGYDYAPAHTATTSGYGYGPARTVTTSDYGYGPTQTPTTSAYDYQPPITTTSSSYNFQAAMAPMASNYELEQGHPAYDNTAHHIPRHTMAPSPYNTNPNNRPQSNPNDPRGQDQSYSMGNEGYGQMQTNGVMPVALDPGDQLYAPQFVNPFQTGPNMTHGTSDQYMYPGIGNQPRAPPKPPTDNEGIRYG